MFETAIGAVRDPFEAGRRYRVIYADPPWSYRDQARAGQRGVVYKYPLLNDADIAALPVARLAADDAMLFLWVTWPKLPEQLSVIDAWGFRYRTVAFVWVKRTRVSGALAWGMGSWTRANSEPCLLATRGRPKRVSAGVHQIVQAPLARHSEKPAQVRDRIVELAGDLPRIELFARQVPPGWDAWGNALSEARAGGPPEPRQPHRARTGPDLFDPGAPLDPAPRGSSAWREQRERLIRHLRANGPVSRAEIAGELGLSKAAAGTFLRHLVRDGTLVQRGRTRGTRYALS